MGLGYLLSLKIRQGNFGGGPFECGFSRRGSPRLNFSIHFFLVAIVFIIFDIELVLLFPLFLTLSYRATFTSLAIVVGFLFILTAGLFFE